MNDFVIRKTLENDLDELWEMKKDFWKIVNLDSLAEVSKEDLRKDLYGESPACHCLVAVAKNKNVEEIAGYALYFPGYSCYLGRSIILEELHVKEKYRRCSCGKLFLKTLSKIVIEGNFNILTLNCLKKNIPAMNLYKWFGMQNITEDLGLEVFEITKAEIFKFMERENVVSET